MIKKFKYVCDGGSIMLGNETSVADFPNNYGDGDFKVTVADREENVWKMSRDWDFKGTVQGSNIHVYKYDCYRGEELMDKDNIAYTLPEGRWAVYASGGNILLVEWD